MNKDLVDLTFRLLFSLIFVGLGSEHMLSDDLIQKLMPAWVPMPSYVSIFCGAVLITGGVLIIIGYQIRFASLMLGAFLIAVTLLVHAPALFTEPSFVHADSQWLWSILQRSNFVKNLCLLGVCLHLVQYTPGKWSVENYLARTKK